MKIIDWKENKGMTLDKIERRHKKDRRNSKTQEWKPWLGKRISGRLQMRSKDYLKRQEECHNKTMETMEWKDKQKMTPHEIRRGHKKDRRNTLKICTARQRDTMCNIGEKGMKREEEDDPR